ncbi:hypothetical protein ACFY4H_13305 [Streptomyces althioticus]|uniref:hypothetical protein n=1 Tax=Streptomyces althioticus TaxID=83380 RepID=UPI00368EDED9
MNHRYPFIVIEGLDGTGKTTLRKGLFRLCEGLYSVTPLCVLTTNFLAADQAAAMVTGKYQPNAENRDAYLSAIAADKRATLDRLVLPQRPARPVIADRWLLSELAFFAVKHGMSGTGDVRDAGRAPHRCPRSHARPGPGDRRLDEPGAGPPG